MVVLGGGLLLMSEVPLLRKGIQGSARVHLVSTQVAHGRELRGACHQAVYKPYTR